MRRTKEEAAATRARLLEAALESFRTKGYAATTVDDIARQAGITRGAIQWHFGTKAELYNALIRENYHEVALAFRETFAVPGTPLQRLRLILVKWLSYTEENAKFRAVLELMMFKTEISPDLAEGIREKVKGTQATIRLFADLIRQGIQAGEIRPDIHPEVAAMAALGLIKGVLRGHLVLRQGRPPLLTGRGFFLGASPEAKQRLKGADRTVSGAGLRPKQSCLLLSPLGWGGFAPPPGESQKISPCKGRPCTLLSPQRTLLANDTASRHHLLLWGWGFRLQIAFANRVPKVGEPIPTSKNVRRHGQVGEVRRHFRLSVTIL